MLPPFRVRRVLPLDSTSAPPTDTFKPTVPGKPHGVDNACIGPDDSKHYTDGYIRMRKEDYQELLKSQPRAALRYIDQDDGEVILVGSVLELEQRLQEPLKHERSIKGLNQSTEAKMQYTTHAFDVEREQAVIDLWRGFHERSKAVESNQDSAERPRRTVRSHENVSFGQPSPLIPTKKPAALSRDNVHTRRWASYSNLTSTFDQKFSPLSESMPNNLPIESDVEISTERLRESSPEELRLATYLSQPSDIENEGVEQTVFSSTLQVSSSLAQEKEYKPLLELFETRLAELASPTSNNASKSGGSTGVQTYTSSSPRSLTASPLESLQTTVPPLDSLAPPCMPEDVSASSPSRAAVEAPLEKFRSLFATFESLAAQYKPVILAVQEQISHAQQTLVGDFSNSVNGRGQPEVSDSKNNTTAGLILGSNSTKSKTSSNIEASAESSDRLGKAANDGDPWTQILSEHLTVQERQFAEHLQEQKDKFVAFLESERQAFSAHITSQKKTVETFIESAVVSRADTNTNLRESKAATQAELAQAADSTVERNCSETQPVQPPSQNSSFNSLSDSALIQFDLDEDSKHASVQRPMSANTESPTRRISDSYSVVSQPADRDVEKIIARRVIYYDGVGAFAFEQFLVRWFGCNSEEDTWCDRKSLKVDPEVISEFERKHARATKFEPFNYDPTKGESSAEYQHASRLHHYPVATLSSGCGSLLKTYVRSSRTPETEMLKPDPITCGGVKDTLGALNTSGLSSSKPQMEHAQPTVRTLCRNELQTLLPRTDSPYTQAPRKMELATDSPTEPSSHKVGSGSPFVSSEEKEGKAAWDLFVQSCNSPSVESKTNSQALPKGVHSSANHYRYMRPDLVLYEDKMQLLELPSLATTQQTRIFPNAQKAKNTPGMSRISRGNFAPPTHDRVEKLRSTIEDSADIEIKPKPRVNDAPAPLPPRVPPKPLVAEGATLWQAMCLSDTFLISRNPQTNAHSAQEPKLTHILDVQDLNGDHAEVPIENKNSLSWSGSYSKIRETSAPSVPKKPVRLQHVSVERSIAALSSQKSAPLIVKARNSAKEETLPKDTDDMLAKIMNKEDFSLLGTSLLDESDLDATLDSLLFPQTVRKSHGAEKRKSSRMATVDKRAETQDKSKVTNIVPENVLETSPPVAQSRPSAPQARNSTSPTSKLAAQPPPGLSSWLLAAYPEGVPSAELSTVAAQQLTNVASLTSKTTAQPPPGLPSWLAAHPALPATASSSTHKFSPNTTPAEKRCASQLIEMGFPSDKAEMISVSVSGDLFQAIEMFEEDQRIWHSQMKGKRKVDGRAAEEVMPGGWDEELYG